MNEMKEKTRSFWFLVTLYFALSVYILLNLTYLILVLTRYIWLMGRKHMEVEKNHEIESNLSASISNSVFDVYICITIRLHSVHVFSVWCYFQYIQPWWKIDIWCIIFIYKYGRYCPRTGDIILCMGTAVCSQNFVPSSLAELTKCLQKTQLRGQMERRLAEGACQSIINIW